ncbi:retrovirus-related pol polyprotein from transposon TNT 1-94 [Tanacetum coccineum]|uniref:Retrovirus-related pol polyprotein from transposon TNT 1-94 n=1 Tax=Tanacetum coccineum TaxID=301880 RepID=A0ABQ4ZFQ7_9ASTR
MSTSNTSTNSNQQTLADSGANERPPMLVKGNYIPWESRFKRFLDNNLEDRERMMVELTYKPRMQVMVEMLTRMQEETELKGFNVGNAGDESNQIIQHVLRTESIPGKANVQCYNCNEKGHYARECQKPKFHDAKYFREQMLLAMKDEARSNLSNEENDFMLDTSYEEDLEELTAIVMLMARLQPADDNVEIIPSYNAKLEKKAFKERENRYLDDILDLEEKLSSYDRIVYKIAGLGYTNPERLKKVIEARPKMYDGDLIHNNKLGIHTTDSEETLEDAEESQNKMRHKMIQIDYEKLNALYETFVPHQEFSAEQTYFSISSTSHNGSTSKDVPSES